MPHCSGGLAVPCCITYHPLLMQAQLFRTQLSLRSCEAPSTLTMTAPAAHLQLIICSPLVRCFQEEEKPYMLAQLANRTNISKQLKETSGIGAHAARPTTQEDASP